MKNSPTPVLVSIHTAPIAVIAHDGRHEHGEREAGAVTRRALEFVAAHEAHRAFVPQKLVYETSDQQRRTIDFFWNLLDFRGRASDKTRWRNCNSVA